MDNQRRPFDGMRELALFAGGGGGILGGKLLGWQTVCAVERDAYAASILAQRQNDGHIKAFPIWSDVCHFDGRPWRGCVDVVSGGFPCQDISIAGNGAGLDGARSGLWREFARIIGEVRPRYAYIENSTRLTVLGLWRVLCDLAALGYDAEWGCLSAGELGAPHERDRLWILAERKQVGVVSNAASQQRDWCRTQSKKTGRDKSTDVCAEIPDAVCQRQPEPWRPEYSGDCQAHRNWQASVAFNDRGWPDEPNIPRVSNGVAYRMDRIKAAGNGQVPRVAAAAFVELHRRLMG